MINNNNGTPLSETRQSNGESLLFDVPPSWKEHWKEMPEFHQENLMPWQTVKIHFRNMEDRRAFGELLKQTLTDETIFLWFPKAEIARVVDKRWDENGSDGKEFTPPSTVPQRLPKEVEETVKNYNSFAELLKVNS